MPTLDLQIAVGGDDWYWTDGNSFFSNSLPRSNVGYYDGIYLGLNTGLLYAVTGPTSGNTVSVAYLSLYAYDNNAQADVNVRITAEDIDSATAPTDWAGANGGTQTTAFTDWTIPAWTTGNWYDSPSIASVIQEVFGRAGWASGNSLKLNIKNNGSTTTNGTLRQITHYETAPTAAAKLHIEYSTAPTIVIPVLASQYRIRRS